MRAPLEMPRQLQEMQRAFSTALLKTDDDLSFLRGEAGQLQLRLAAYRRNVLGNWRAALASTYATVRSALGADAFDNLAARYCTTHPARSGDLNEYGRDFPQWLAESAHWAGGFDVALIADLAQLDVRLQDAYYAPDHDPLDLAVLAAIPADCHDRLRIRLAPSLSLIRSRWQIAAWWQALQTQDAETAPAESCSAAWTARRGGLVWPEPASIADAVFIDALLAGESLAEAIAQACDENAGFDAGGLLVRLAGSNAIAGIQAA